MRGRWFEEEEGVVKVYPSPIRRWWPRVTVLLGLPGVLVASYIFSQLDPAADTQLFVNAWMLGVFSCIALIVGGFAWIFQGRKRIEFRSQGRTIRAHKTPFRYDDFRAVMCEHDRVSRTSSNGGSYDVSVYRASLVYDNDTNAQLLRNLFATAQKRDEEYDMWNTAQFANALHGLRLMEHSDDAVPMQITEMAAKELGVPMYDFSGAKAIVRPVESLDTPLLELIGTDIELPRERPAPPGCAVEKSGDRTLLRFPAATIPWLFGFDMATLFLAGPTLILLLLGMHEPSVFIVLGMGGASLFTRILLRRRGSEIRLQITPETIQRSQGRRRDARVRTIDVEQLRVPQGGGMELRADRGRVHVDIEAPDGPSWLRAEILHALARTRQRPDADGAYR